MVALQLTPLQLENAKANSKEIFFLTYLLQAKDESILFSSLCMAGCFIFFHSHGFAVPMACCFMPLFFPQLLVCQPGMSGKCLIHNTSKFFKNVRSQIKGRMFQLHHYPGWAGVVLNQRKNGSRTRGELVTEELVAVHIVVHLIQF